MRVIGSMLLVFAMLTTAGRASAQSPEATQPATQPATQTPAPAVGDAQTRTPPSSNAQSPAEATRPKTADEPPTPFEVVAFVSLFLLGAGAVYFTIALISKINEGQAVAVESHWGGLGGGLGGWRVSGTLSLLIGSLLFATAFTAVAIKLLDIEASKTHPAKAAASAVAAPAGGAAR